jgi:hypothetical protein
MVTTLGLATTELDRLVTWADDIARRLEESGAKLAEGLELAVDLRRTSGTRPRGGVALE